MRFASLLTVDRHGLRPRDDKMCHGALCLSLRGGQNGRRGNPSCLEGRDRVCLFASRPTVDRHGLSSLAMKRSERNGGVQFGSNTIFVIPRKERSERRGNPLYAMDAFEQCGSLPSSQWIATGYALAMTRCGSDAVYQSRTTHHVIARKERSEGRGNPLYAMDAFEQCGSLPSSQWIATGFRPRDDKVGKEWGCAVRFQHDLCHCEEGTQVTDAAIHCMQWTRTDCAVRFSAHSGSPRPTPSR